jgi:hypothetical protein
MSSQFEQDFPSLKGLSIFYELDGVSEKSGKNTKMKKNKSGKFNVWIIIPCLLILILILVYLLWIIFSGQITYVDVQKNAL